MTFDTLSALKILYTARQQCKPYSEAWQLLCAAYQHVLRIEEGHA